jgi:type II secretory pathway pseudopilin PulG
MLIVITILVTMVLVALPFALSMRQGQERTEAMAARERARQEAETLAQLTTLFLSRGQPYQEQKRAEQGETSVDAMPNVDSLEEILPGDMFREKISKLIESLWLKDPAMATRASSLASRGLTPLNDDRGSIWTVLVQDAQALVNVNGASPFLLANLLGAAQLSDDLDTSSTDIGVENVVTGHVGGLRGFPADGGTIRIGREVIRYTTFDGETFHGCERGVLQDTPLGDNSAAEKHDGGTPVIAYAAYKLATNLIARHPGRLTPFQNLEALRDIASWGEGGVITASRLEEVLPYLTVWSKREGSAQWLADQLIVNELPSAVDGAGPDEVRVRDQLDNPAGTTAYFSPGTIVRITDGQRTVYQTVSDLGDEKGRLRDYKFTTGGSVVAAAQDKDVKFLGGQTKAAVFAPYPININTAPREVLYAVMANLQLANAKGKDQVVTPEMAWDLAGQIVDARKGSVRVDKDTQRRVAGPFRSAEDFGRWLDAKVKNSEIKRIQQAALYLNAINPHCWMLRFGTAPWCYKTLDVYHIESRVALNNRAGEQIAQANVREVVEIGADTTATWVLDSQEDFERHLEMGSGAKWVTTYPFSVAYKNRAWHHIQPALRGPKGFLQGVYPSMTRDKDVGDVRLEPARMLLPGAQVVQHFDSSTYADGHFTGYDGPYNRNVKGTWATGKDGKVRPFSMSFWWRPYAEQEDWTVFDAGIDAYQNRVALFVQQAQEGPELTFRVCAGTLWRQGAEVYVPMSELDYQPGNWYHIQVSCAGEDPATMQLLVDGVDISRRRGLTLTTGALTTDATEISVESTDGFPMRGSLRIGTEIVEYQTRDDGAFRECVRGARGTTPQEFPSDTPVYVNGYSMPITVDIMKGGAHLPEPLGRWSALRISTLNGGQPAPDTVTVTVDGSSTPIVLAGFGPDNTNITVTGVGMWGQDDSKGADAFNTKGLALLGCPRVGNASASGGSGGPVSPADPPAGGGGGYHNPGGAVPPGRTPPPSSGGSSGGGTNPGPGSGGSSGGSSGNSPAAGSSDVKLGGWEVVYYERNGNEFTIKRYQKTAWQGEADHYFLITENQSAATEYPCFIVPISVLGTGGVARGDDYLDPSQPEQQTILTNYYKGDASARVALPVDSGHEGQTEVIRYDSIDRDHASPDILFVRDRSIGSTTSHFFGDPQTISGGSATNTDPGDTTPPVPPPDTEPPVPPPGDTVPPSVPPDDGGDKPPTPGDGVPPGAREPSDPPTADPGDTGGGDTGGGDSGGGTEPGAGDGSGPSTPGSGGASDGSDEPTGGDSTTDGSDPVAGGDDTGNGNAGSDKAGGEEENPGNPGDNPPPEEEPTPDGSGTGGDQGSTPDTENDSKIPNVPIPPAVDERSDSQGDGTVWEPTGPETARNLLQFRGVNGTYDWKHAGGGDSESYYLPCFRAWETFVTAPVARTGRNDVITITDGGKATQREEMGIRWGDRSSDWVCLTDFPSRRTQAPKTGANVRRNDPRNHPRILRFPCGELPDEMSPQIEFGQSSISGASLVTAFLDELNVWRNAYSTALVVYNTDGLDEGGDEIRVANTGTTQDMTTVDGYDKDCGLVLVGGELVVYRGSHMEGDKVLVLERCARGQLGTRTTFHPLGDRVRFIPDVPVSYLDSGMSVDSSSIPLATTRGFPAEGLVRVLHEDTAELMHYTRRSASELTMPASLDASDSSRNRGLFRGRFGTDATDHDADEIVVFQPFRYWDRFTPRRTEDNESFSGVYDHPETSYLELGTRKRSALWRGFSWSENLFGRSTGSDAPEDDRSAASSGYLDIWVLARFNPNIPWDTTNVVDMRQSTGLGRQVDLSSQQNTHLFLFDSVGDAAIGGGRHGNPLNVESDTAEFRIYFVYKANAFVPVDGIRRSGQGDLPILSNTWKQSPWLRALHVNYFNTTQTLYKAAVR